MMYRILLLGLLLTPHLQKAHSMEATPLERALNLLAQTKTGSEELKLARQLNIPIRAGAVSKTDITATRSLKNNEEILSFQTQVIVAQDKDAIFQALDLAHELVHATHPKSNPFDPKLNFSDYVKHGIEGEGGEAQAIEAECKAGQELIEESSVKSQIKAETVQLIKARCQFVWQTAQNASKWKQSFYYLGQYYRDFMSQVYGLNLDQASRAEWREKVEAKSPMFASAVAHKPYPLALLEEYVEITKRVCERTKTSTVGRAIASLPLLQERCKAIGSSLSP